MESPLAIAVKKGYYEMVQILLNIDDIDINAIDNIPIKKILSFFFYGFMKKCLCKKPSDYAKKPEIKDLFNDYILKRPK